MEVAASVIAIIQISDTVLRACKSYIDAFQDYPKDLRLIYVEISSIKAIFEALNFFDPDDSQDSAALAALLRPDGPVEGCKRAIGELNQLLPRAVPQIKTRKSKRQKLDEALVALAWPLKCDKARKLLDELNSYKATISMAFTGQLMHELRSVKTVVRKVDQALTDAQRRECCDWLEIINPSSNHNDAVDLYVEGTGNWVFRSTPWQEWINQNKRAIWMHGIPGAGKTVLVAYLIQHVLSGQGAMENAACVYFYCYHAHNRDESIPFLRWLLSQLCRKMSYVPEAIYEAFESNHDPGRDLLLDGLAEILQHFDTVWVMIDALDESEERGNILSLLRLLQTNNRFRRIQLFAASREYFDIEQVMLSIADSLSLSNPWVEEDINSFIGEIIKKQSPFNAWPPDISQEVQGTLAKRAKGMFRWAVCQLDILRRLKSIKRVRRAISSLPETLDDTYERIFAHIDPGHRDLVRHTLRWIYAHNAMNGEINQRNISSGVLLDAYLHLQEEESADFFCFDLETLRESCGCLVTWTTEVTPDGAETQTAKIAHYTVREFLESDRSPKSASFFSLRRWEVFGDVLSSLFSRATNTKLLKTPCFDQTMINLDQYCSHAVFAAFMFLEPYVNLSLACDFLDPQSTSYPRLNIKQAMSFDGHCNHNATWAVDWMQWKEDSTGIGLALQLIELETWNLLERYVHSLDSTEILKVSFLMKMDSFREDWTAYFLDDDDYDDDDDDDDDDDCVEKLDFHGTILDYFAVFIYNNLESTSEIFSFLLHHAGTGVNLDSILQFYAAKSGNHQIRGTGTFLAELLELGADPNSNDFRVTPLQIGCLMGSMKTIRTLLECQADPNLTGNPSQPKWDDTYILRAFRVLHGLSPLKIIRTFRRKFLEEDEIYAMEQVLIAYGAKDFKTYSFDPEDIMFIKFKGFGRNDEFHSGDYDTSGDDDTSRDDNDSENADESGDNVE
ncbi:Vegetative incompatibility HET-E-1 [Fusarium albosuccineum]|uniref:Vegetative incompatibility HET-E-1 n=1 Tax=Fusarium albosuccineum TaxID=1237068 RepID=A0A8H4L767_9HYPO|nr:Vegetative incompatibility HET-E-1 [Fusarium albosuccineum]